jgi:hypothetical protein
MHLSGALERSSQWADRTFSDRHAVCAVQMKESQCVFGAVVHIGITANAGHRKQVDLWSHHRAGNRQRVIEPWVAIDDER